MIKYGGAVAACGLAGGMDLPASVAPFILRGVTLAGVDSVMAPKAARVEAWARLARDLDRAKLAAMTVTRPAADVVALAPEILAGKVRGPDRAGAGLNWRPVEQFALALGQKLRF